MKKNLALSQFRHADFEYIAEDAVNFMAFPVMRTFERDADLVGVVVNNVMWRSVFHQMLPYGSGSFICVLENSFNQSVSYRVDGHLAEYLGGGKDFHDSRFDSLVAITDTEETARRLQDPAARSYMSLPLNIEYGKYTLRIYPTSETEDMFLTQQPWQYVFIVIAVAFFISAMFVAFVYYVERRQRILMERVVHSAEKVASAERDLNEYLAHGELVT